MTDQTTAGAPPPADTPGGATPEPVQALRAAVEAVTAARYHGQPSLPDIDTLLMVAQAPVLLGMPAFPSSRSDVP